MLAEEDLVFVISLPRSGSTLLQRILSTQPNVATSSETWALLPQIYAMREHGAYTEYDHATSSKALREFLASSPALRRAYVDGSKRLVLGLFAAKMSSSETIFVEKTPRNSLVIEEIVNWFPESKIVFLWRNPLAIAASMISTFGHGNWNLYKYRIDLDFALPRIIDCWSDNKERFICVRYEDLVENPKHECRRLGEYLGLKTLHETYPRFSEIVLNGSMGDPKRNSESNVSNKPADAWTQVLANPIRRAWAKRYLNSIGRCRLSAIGYDLDELLESLELTKAEFDGIGSDLLRIAYGRLDRVCEIDLLRSKRRLARSGQLLFRNS